MIEIKTGNADARISKTDSGVELQEWRIRNSQPSGRLALKSPHFHNDYQIGFVTDGAIENRYRGKQHIVLPRMLYAIQPGEVHAEDIVQGSVLQFCFAFIAPKQVNQAIEDITDGRQKIAFMPNLLITNPHLNRHLTERTDLFFSTLQHKSSGLEQESCLLNWLTDVLAGQGGPTLITTRLGDERKPVGVVRAYLADNFTRSVSLDELAQVARLSKFHLLRSFVKETGMTVHRYQMQLRICRAKELLKTGRRVVDVALDLGFTDQAHFSRYFKRFTSQTPARF